MFNAKTLGEKLKYLFISEMRNYFDLQSLEIEFDNFDGEKEYDVNLSFDYFGQLDSELPNLITNLEQMSSKLILFFEKYQISKDGKLVLNNENFISDMLIWKMDYTFDEKHEFTVSFKIVIRK
jgi:hypothetical protein